MPTEIFFSVGGISSLNEVTSRYEPEKIMLVTGRTAMKKAGVTDRIVDYFNKNNIETYVFDKIGSNPSTTIIEEGVGYTKESEAELVVGVGGGSAMDAAKCIALLYNNFDEDSILEYINNKELIKNKGLPCITIPTTSGTGAEVTRWATVWDKEEKKKLSMEHPYMYPEIALLDPELTVYLPKKQTSSTGVDALSQCIESYWSKNHNPISDLCALEGIKLVFENLEGAYNEPENIQYRTGMSMAALCSGMAINGTKTTACHSTSYPMTAHFDIPHGHACCITVPGFMRYNADVVPERIQRISDMAGARTIEEGAENIIGLMENLELETKLSDLGINERGIETIIEDGFTPDRVKHNPRELTAEDLRKILLNIL